MDAHAEEDRIWSLEEVEECKKEAESITKFLKLYTRRLARSIYPPVHEFPRVLERIRLASLRLDQLLSIYGRVSCRQLCEKLTITLPYELRDIIYTDIVRDTAIRKSGAKVLISSWHPLAFFMASAEDPGFPPALITNMVEEPLRYLVDRRYVGTKFLYEISRELFKPACLEFDKHRIGLLPIILGPHMPTKRFTLRPEQFMRCLYFTLPQGTVEWNTWKALDSILQLKRKASMKIDLDIEFGGVLTRINGPAQWLNQFAPLYALMRRASVYGHTIELHIIGNRINNQQRAQYSSMCMSALANWLTFQRARRPLRLQHSSVQWKPVPTPRDTGTFGKDVLASVEIVWQ